nr:chorismate mutase [uncultured Bdellovibrio sp.]
METIASLRQEIDQVHKELHDLLLRRRDLTMAVWKIKKEQGLPFYSPEREEQILKDFVSMGTGSSKDPLFEELLKNVMESILREYQKYLNAKYPQK